MENIRIKRTIVTDVIMGDTCFKFGRIDAIQDLPCQPLTYFREADSIVHYTLGYEEVAGPTPETRAILFTWDSLEIRKDYIPVDWEMSYLDDKLGLWLPVIEAQVRDHLKGSYSDVETHLAIMRAMPIDVEVKALRAKFRFAPQAPFPEDALAQEAQNE